MTDDGIRLATVQNVYSMINIYFYVYYVDFCASNTDV